MDSSQARDRYLTGLSLYDWMVIAFQPGGRSRSPIKPAARAPCDDFGYDCTSEIFGKHLGSSRLLPVRIDGTPAMLKIAVDVEEKFGRLLMKWWDGQGAARVFAHEDDALLMERAEGLGSLVNMTRSGRDDEARGSYAT
jgi:hypothetical protein